MIDPNKILDSLLEFYAELNDDPKHNEKRVRFISRYNPFVFAIWIYNKEPNDYKEYLTYYSQMIDKLHDDKYISFHASDRRISKNNGGYIEDIDTKITFMGVMFHLSGGYSKADLLRQDKNNRLENLESHQKRHGSYMTWLTLTLALFALASVALQVFDKFHFVFRIHILMALILLLVGVILGTIITILLLTVWKWQPNKL